MPRQRNANSTSVIRYALAHPSARQKDIGARFGISRFTVGRILRAAGVVGRTAQYRKGKLKRRDSQSSLQFYWEQRLHDEGLGMDRGLNNHRLLY